MAHRRYVHAKCVRFIPCDLLMYTLVRFLDETPTQWLLPMPSISQRDTAIDAGIKALGDRELVEEFVQSPDVDTPSFRHQRAVSTTAEARKLTRRAYVENHATLCIAKQWVTHVRQSMIYVSTHGISEISGEHFANILRTFCEYSPQAYSQNIRQRSRKLHGYALQ